MEKSLKRIIVLCVCLVLLTVCVLTACDQEPQVTVLDGAQTEYTLDVYSGGQQQLKAEDYFNENGLENVTYSAVSDNEEVIKVSEKEGKIFLAEALKEGSANVVLSAIVGEEAQAKATIAFTVTDSSPKAPSLDKSEYQYDRAVGGVFELPVALNGGRLSIIKINGENIQSDLYEYKESSSCIEIAESYMFGLAEGQYEVTLITTGGSAEFNLIVTNSITTTFDEVTEKTAILGKTEQVSFSIDFNGTTVKSLAYGEYVLSADEYAVGESSVSVKEAFYKKTYSDDSRKYRLTLSNNESYEFSITTNVLFYSDYDVTTIHDTLLSDAGQNSLYQDSTIVDIIDAPDNSGLGGKVLKYVPHTGDVALDAHGIFTFENDGGQSTWRKVRFVEGKTYIVSFDYMTIDTTEGEDFRFRSYNGTLMGPAIDTGKAGELLHYSYSFSYSSSQAAFMLYGKFINGGYLLIDNYSLIELDSALPVITAGNYLGDADYSVSVVDNGYVIKDILIDGESVAYNYNQGSLTIAQSVMESLEYGAHKLTLVTGVGEVSEDFLYEDTSVIVNLTETSKSFSNGITSLKLAGEFSQDVTVQSIVRKGTSPFDSAYSEAKAISASYVTVESDGIVLSQALLDQVYDTCTYTIKFSNDAEYTFTLTSDMLFYSNYDETELWNGGVVNNYAFHRENPADGMVEIASGAEGFEGQVLKYTPTEDSWFLRILTMQHSSLSYNWTPLAMEADEYYEIFFDYEIVGTESANTGFYYTTAPTSGEVLMDNGRGKKHFSWTVKGSDFTIFAIGYWPSYDKGCSMYIDNYGVRKTTAPEQPIQPTVTNLIETSKSFSNGIASLKLAGEFSQDVTVQSIVRKGTSPFDSAYSEAKAISASYVTVESDGIVLSQALLDQVYDTCTYTIKFSNDAEYTFTLTSDMLFYSNYDETELWNGGVVNDYAWHREDLAAAMVELVNNVEGFEGQVLKYTPSGDSWYIRILTMQNASASYGWTPLAVEADEYYEIFFDYEIITSTTPTYGFYYKSQADGGEIVMDNTAGKKHFSWTVKGSDFTAFAIGYWPGDAAGSTMYIDNYGVRKTAAPAQA